MANSDHVGKEQERRIVRWFRANGFPHADRVVRAGAGKGYAYRADEGDIALCPGIVVQSKRLSPINRMERAIPAWMTQTEAQRVAAAADIALLVVRREGTTDVGEWWAWLPLWQLTATSRPNHWPPTLRTRPVRLTVTDAAQLIRAAGYGNPLENEAA